MRVVLSGVSPSRSETLFFAKRHARREDYSEFPPRSCRESGSSPNSVQLTARLSRRATGSTACSYSKGLRASRTPSGAHSGEASIVQGQRNKRTRYMVEPRMSQTVVKITHPLLRPTGQRLAVLYHLAPSNFNEFEESRARALFPTVQPSGASITAGRLSHPRSVMIR